MCSKNSLILITYKEHFTHMNILQALFPHRVSVFVTFSITCSILSPPSFPSFSFCGHYYATQCYCQKYIHTYFITAAEPIMKHRKTTITFHNQMRFRTRSFKSFFSMSVSLSRRWSMRRYIILVLCQNNLSNKHFIAML